MKPKFNNPRQTLLWNVLTYGTAIVAGGTLGLFSEQLGTAGTAAVIVATAVILAALYWWAYRTRLVEVEDEIMQERKNRTTTGAMSESAQRVNIYNIKVHNSPTKVIMEALTVLLLLVTWGIFWSKHQMDWEHIGGAVILTIGSVAALIGARFPFMLHDAEKQKDMSLISLSVKKQQVYALICAIMAVLSPVADIMDNFFVIILAILLVEAYFNRKKKSAQSTSGSTSGQVTDKAFDSSNIQVTHDKVEIAFYIVTGFIILTALCFVLLSLDVIKVDAMRFSTRLLFILLTAFSAINQLASAVKFAKVDEEIENIRQFRLSVLENRVYGVELASISLILAIGIKHHIVEASVLIIAILAMFLGTYFIFKHFSKKAK
ncbi:MAG: hypothetical protein IJG42_01610 [Muribaculaceae bacterium]|nr:hypothetical protein [Muribaculaceae bacterium]